MSTRAFIITYWVIAAGVIAALVLFMVAAENQLPGTLNNGSTATLIWATFWASLLAGMVVTLAVGAIVTIFGRWWASEIQKGREGQQARNDIALYKAQLQNFLSLPPLRDIHAPANIVPPFVHQVSALVRKAPISYWLPLLDEVEAIYTKPVLNASITFLQCYQTYRNATLEIEHYLAQAIRKEDVRNGVGKTISTRGKVTYALGVLATVDQDVLRDDLAIESGWQTSMDGYAQMVHDRTDLHGARDNYVSALTDLRKVTRRLAVDVRVNTVDW